MTSLGDQGVRDRVPVIYPPQVAIVGFGRVSDRPWAVDAGVRAVPVVTASVGADHRVSDGHRGALFLAAVGDGLQRPDELAKGVGHDTRRTARDPAFLLPVARIAPEVDVDSIVPAVPPARPGRPRFRRLAQFPGRRSRRLGVDIPDAEAARLPTLDSLLDYCGARLGVA